jgi:hypothetical protein
LTALKKDLEQWADIIQRASLPDDMLYLAAHAAFDFIKARAITTKHKGFSEEKEWRVIYATERDHNGYLKECLDYFIGPRGVEPKLKYKLGKTYASSWPIEADALKPWTITNIIYSIILGPSVSSPIAKNAFKGMLKNIDMSALADRVDSSTIPLRPTL